MGEKNGFADDQNGPVKFVRAADDRGLDPALRATVGCVPGSMETKVDAAPHGDHGVDPANKIKSMAPSRDVDPWATNELPRP